MIKIPKSLTEVVKRKLKLMIVRNEFAFGQQLAENELSKHFGVSKTPIREALVQLKKEGLVVVRARCGTFVYTPTQEDIEEIVQCRAMLEEAALRLAYKKKPAQLLFSLGKIVEQMTRGFTQDNYVEYLDLDAKYHNIIFEIADNTYLSEFYKTLATKISAMRYRLKYDDPFLLRSTEGHVNIYNQLLENNIESAAELLRQHVSGVFLRVELSPLADDKPTSSV